MPPGGGGALRGTGRSWRRVAASGFREEEEGAAHGTPASRLHAAVPKTSWVRLVLGFRVPPGY